MLYIVSTPIGNLKDISLRALEVLKEVDLIAAEDTRHTSILLAHYDIHVPMISYFEHNKIKKGAQIIRMLQEGRNVALVTDSGTPGISDPGYRLINMAIENEIAISALPGPCALIDALVLSGFPSDQFIFMGYMPVKTGARRKRIEEIKDETRTVIFYETPHRILRCLEDLSEILGDRAIALARELTKKFEEVMRAPAAGILEKFKERLPRGEFVVMVKGKGK